MKLAARRPTGLDRQVVHPRSQPLAHLSRQPLRRRLVVVGRRRRAVALEAMCDVEVLLEMVAQRKVDEGPTVRDQLHGRREPALDHRQVAARERAVPVVDVTHRAHAGQAASNFAGEMRGPHTMRGLGCQLGGRGMHLFARGRQQGGQRRLRQPLDLQPRHLAPQLASDGDVAPGVSEST